MTNIKELTKVIALHDSKMFSYIKNNLPKGYQVVTDNKNYLFAAPAKHNGICLVSHIDTVRRGCKVNIKNDNGILYNKKGILGADDRAGVYAILQIIKKNPAIVLFTNFEEVGGIGVNEFINARIFDSYINEVNLFVELDRRGINEYVVYNGNNSDLDDIMSTMGYEKKWGSYSDVHDLTEAYGICHVNLSVGYFNQHTENEYLSVAGVEFAISSCLGLMKKIKKQYVVELKKDYYGKDFVADYYGETHNYVKQQEDDVLSCPMCGEDWDIIYMEGNDRYVCECCGTIFNESREIVMKGNVWNSEDRKVSGIF